MLLLEGMLGEETSLACPLIPFVLAESLGQQVTPLRHIPYYPKHSQGHTVVLSTDSALHYQILVLSDGYVHSTSEGNSMATSMLFIIPTPYCRVSWDNVCPL